MGLFFSWGRKGIRKVIKNGRGIGLIGGLGGIEKRKLREILEIAKRSNVLCTLVSISRYYIYTSALGISMDKSYMRS